MKRIIFIIIFLFLYAGISLAQGSSTFPVSPGTAAYSYTGTMGDQDQLRIYTYIWGQVRKPGLYIVPDNIDLLALISLAGGPTKDAKLSKVRIVRQDMNGKNNEVIWINLKKYIDNGDRSIIPLLKAGDTVIVSGTVYYGLTRASSLVSTVVSIFNIYFLYLNLIKK